MDELESVGGPVAEPRPSDDVFIRREAPVAGIGRGAAVVPEDIVGIGRHFQRREGAAVSMGNIRLTQPLAVADDLPPRKRFPSGSAASFLFRVNLAKA